VFEYELGERADGDKLGLTGRRSLVGMDDHEVDTEDASGEDAKDDVYDSDDGDCLEAAADDVFLRAAQDADAAGRRVLDAVDMLDGDAQDTAASAPAALSLDSEGDDSTTLLQDDTDTVCFNVGGTTFVTTRRTLESDRPNFLLKMLEPYPLLTPSVRLNRDVFVDRDPELFRGILMHLRGHRSYIDTLSEGQMALLLEEAEFYALSCLTHQLRQRLCHSHSFVSPETVAALAVPHVITALHILSVLCPQRVKRHTSTFINQPTCLEALLVDFLRRRPALHRVLASMVRLPTVREDAESKHDPQLNNDAAAEATAPRTLDNTLEAWLLQIIVEMVPTAFAAALLRGRPSVFVPARTIKALKALGRVRNVAIAATGRVARWGRPCDVVARLTYGLVSRVLDVSVRVVLRVF
jgi:hypothetical protein